MREIDNASVMGFIPTQYPAGVVLAERWNFELNGIERVTALVENIDESRELTNVVSFNYDLEAARADFIARALEAAS